MQIGGVVIYLAARSLAESMDVHTMTHLARRLIKDYDLYERAGFPRNIAIPNKDAAYQIVKDMKDQELFLPFVKLLIDIRETGLMGRKYRVPYLRDIVTELHNAGFILDRETGIFVENPAVRKTKNWGVLREFEEYIFTFLSIDIVDNSGLVKRYPRKKIEEVYAGFRTLVQNIVEKRCGRIWNWEGDGGLCAFYFFKKNNLAAHSAMEILHELYIYNLLNQLEEPINVRIAVHSGPCQYRHDFEKIKSDTIQKTIEIEAIYTAPNSATFSQTVYCMLDHIIAVQLIPLQTEGNGTYYSYQLKWGI